MSRDNLQIAMALKQLRKEHLLSQQELADLIGVRKTTISNYETGYSVPNIATIQKLLNVFNINFSSFYDMVDSSCMLSKKEIQMFDIQSIPFYHRDNIEGMLSNHFTTRNSNIRMPNMILKRHNATFSTTVPDYAMNCCGIMPDTCIFVDTTADVQNNDIVLAVKSGRLIIRRYKNEDDEECLITESTKIPQRETYYPFPDENIQIIGVVVAVINEL